MVEKLGLRVGIFSYHEDQEEILRRMLIRLGHEVITPAAWESEEIKKLLDKEGKNLDVVMVYTHPRSSLTSESITFEARKRNSAVKCVILTLRVSSDLKKYCDAIAEIPFEQQELDLMLRALFGEGSKVIH